MFPPQPLEARAPLTSPRAKAPRWAHHHPPQRGHVLARPSVTSRQPGGALTLSPSDRTRTHSVLERRTPPPPSPNPLWNSLLACRWRGRAEALRRLLNAHPLVLLFVAAPSGEERTEGPRTKETGGEGVVTGGQGQETQIYRKCAGHFKIFSSQMSHRGQLTSATEVSR